MRKSAASTTTEKILISHSNSSGTRSEVVECDSTLTLEDVDRLDEKKKKKKTRALRYDQMIRSVFMNLFFCLCVQFCFK